MSRLPGPIGESLGLPPSLDSREFGARAAIEFARYPRRINALLPILQLAAAQIPLAPRHVGALARWCWATPEQGLLVARAYRLLAEDGAGDRVTICMNVHCLQAGSDGLRDTCRTILQGQPVIVDELSCFGHCTESPCAEVNGRLIVEATPAQVITRGRRLTSE